MRGNDMTGQHSPASAGCYDRTIPWSNDEMIHVDGLPMVYSIDEKGLLVHMPGGRPKHPCTYRVEHLLMNGHKVKMPRIIRRFA